MGLIDMMVWDWSRPRRRRIHPNSIYARCKRRNARIRLENAAIGYKDPRDFWG